MAHSLSSKKRIRQNTKRRLVNRARRSALKSKLRDCQESFLHGSTADQEKLVLTAIQCLDRDANRGTLHANAAARRKSRLLRKLNTLRQKAAPPAGA